MSYLVSALPDDELLLNCTDTVTSVLQNIKCIIQTRKGDIPLHRGIGPDGELDRQADYSCPYTDGGRPQRSHRGGRAPCRVCAGDL